MYRNTINSKCYVGKCHGNVKRRQNAHVNGNGSILLKQAFAKYGVENFTFEILHDGVFDELLDDYEIEAIAKHNSLSPNGYNLKNGGGSGTHSEESKRKMSESLKGRKLSPEHCKNMGKARRGGKLPPEAIEKMRKAAIGRKHTPETRRKLSEIQRGRKRSPEAVKKTADAIRGVPKNPFRDNVKTFYFSLLSDMSISEKRAALREKFPNVSKSTIHFWTKKWQSE